VPARAQGGERARGGLRNVLIQGVQPQRLDEKKNPAIGGKDIAPCHAQLAVLVAVAGAQEAVQRPAANAGN
jgi:hypothetical protein